MSATDPRYAPINGAGTVWPPLSRKTAGRFAWKLLEAFSNPEDAAYRDDGYGGHRAALVGELTRIYRRYNNGQHGPAPHLGRTCWASTRSTTGHHKGWGRLIHDVSHMVHEWRHPRTRPHDNAHAKLELEMVAFVLARGWQVPAPRKAKPSTGDKRAQRLARLEQRLVRWYGIRRRADRAVRKIEAQVRYLYKAQERASTAVQRETMMEARS